MFKNQVTGIDRDLLAEAVRAELAAAALRGDRKSQAPLPLVSSATGGIPLRQRIKQRLRAMPVLGDALVWLNAQRRRLQPRRRLLAMPLLGSLIRWSKSVICLTETRTAVHAAQVHLRELQNQAHGLERQTGDLRRLQEDLKRALKSQYETLQSQNEALRKTFAEHSAAVGADLAGLRTDIQFQQRRLSRFISDAGQPSAPVAASASSSSPSAASDLLDAYYANFENRFRGSHAEIKARLGIYVERLVAAEIAALAKPVLDIGCGRGEWLELLAEAGIRAYGVDTNSVTVATGQQRGLDMRGIDALSHLRSLENASLGAVTGFHLIEHLPFEVLIELLDEVNRTLTPGGLLLLETPNPENLLVGACNFYNDPTHRNPLPPLVTGFMVESRGFTAVEILPLHPYPPEFHLREESEAARRLNQLLYGPQDYAVIARKA